MKKWIAAILILVMLTQALPFTAFADAVAAGKMITDGELQCALQIAGMQVVADISDTERPIEANGALKLAKDRNTSLRVKAKDSGYHSGMAPDETWDAQMLMDWLDDKLTREIYNVINVYARAEAILERLKDSDSDAYAQYTQNADYLDICHKWAMDAEVVEEKGRLLRKRVGENTVVIESNTEMLANAADSLFEHEKARYSEQIREAMAALEELRYEIVEFSIAQIYIIITGQLMIDGTIDPEFSAWLKDVLGTEDGPNEVTVPSNAIIGAAYNTRTSRMAVSERVLSNPGSQDVSVQVVTENEFAIVTKGVDNQAVGGVSVTVKDLNGSAVKTLTTDNKYGSAIFNANDFICDYDKEMELSLEVRADSQGYRNFYIPWMILKRGGRRTETLTLLTGPETRANAAAREAELANPVASNAMIKPYIYSCTFNGYDILHNDKATTISSANDAQVSFEVVVAHPAGMTLKAPELHCYVNDTSGLLTRTVKKQFSPGAPITEGATLTKYVFKSTWKRDLAPEITVDKNNPSRDQRPYFVLPDTGEVYRSKLVPKRSKVDMPTITGQEHKNPFNTVLGKGFGLDFDIPHIGGRLSLSLPFDQYLPKVAFDPTGWVTVTFGSSLVKDPKDATIWKTQEQEQYGKAMKKFQHDTSLASKKQALGTAKDFYKPITQGGSHQASVKFDFGYFVMLSGYGELDDRGGSLWSLRGATGGEFVLSADYTVAITVVFVPVYMNVNFSLSTGVSIDALYLSFGFDRDFKLTSFDWNAFRGITFNFRLALSISLGIGIKGLLSMWISATGCLNFIVSLMQKQPTKISVYLELFVSVGFEIFWIKYTKDIWQSPKFMIYSNSSNSAKAPFSLFTAYAEEEETDDMPLNPLEPQRYAQLAPSAKRLMSNEENVKTGIKVLEYQGRTLVFYIGEGTDVYGNTRRCVCWMDPATGKQERLPYNFDSVNAVGDRTMSDYGFDVATDGNTFAIAGCCADLFDEKGVPVPGRVKYYSVILGPDDHDVVPNSDYKCHAILQNWMEPRASGYDQISNPRIDGLISRFTDVDRDFIAYTIYGAFDASYSKTGDRGIIGFEASTEGAHAGYPILLPDITIKNSANADYDRVEVFTEGKSGGDFTQKIPSTSSCVGFVSLSKPKEGAEGDSIIELFDFSMNSAPYKTTLDSSRSRRIVVSSDRRTIELARGDIDHIEVVRTLQADGRSHSRTIFYTQAETEGDRKVNRLKSIYVPPKTGVEDNIKFDVSYNDYDLSLPSTQFRAVTLGSSQYLYWLSTVSKDRESDPDVWRITGVYYDASTNTMSDQLVIAEFALPDVQWKGKNWKSVPYEIRLEENGYGYITAKPDTANEEDHDIAPTTLYSFPIVLKPVATLKGASLMETTVCQGEIVTTDVTVMNEGNMGIGSFDVELWLMEEGREKQKIETLHADCLLPANSKLVLHTGDRDEIVVEGEEAFYRLKDFIYSPRQKEWIVKREGKTFTVKGGNDVTVSSGDDSSSRVVTNVLVPGSQGGYTGHIKIPSDWSGEKQLRLKLTRESTYSNWLAASALAKSNPELFAKVPVEKRGSSAASNASANARTLAKLGIVKLDYVLDGQGDKLTLQAPEGFYIANGNDGTAQLCANGNGDESIRLYATELKAPKPIDIECNVHDIDVSHRVYDDYYGEEMLEITLNNYNTNKDTISLTCAVYVNDSEDPVYVNLPYTPDSISTGRTQTITVPVSAIVDPATTEKARFVFTPRGIKETATVNNEFTIYPGGNATPEPLTVTGEGPLTPTKDVDGGIIYVDVPLVVDEGDTAVFHVDVKGGTPPYKYQWQVYDPAKGAWVNLVDGGSISGATTDTLTLRDVKAEWDGRRARCLISDADGEEIRYVRELRVRTGGESGMPETGDHSHLPLYLAIALATLALWWMMRRRA